LIVYQASKRQFIEDTFEKDIEVVLTRQCRAQADERRLLENAGFAQIERCI